MGPSRKFLSGHTDRASFLIYICKIFIVHFGRIDCWIHLRELKQHYLQRDIELKIIFDTYHHSRISSNSSLKLVLHFTWRSTKRVILPAKFRILFVLSHSTPCCFFTGLPLYITVEIYCINAFCIDWTLILCFPCYPHITFYPAPKVIFL